MRDRRKILTVVGVRPQFVKAAVVSRAIRDGGWSDQLEEVLVHTGQHYDQNMSDVFFRELGIPQPKINLEVGSGAPHTQMATMLERLGPVVLEEQPNVVLVYGDTNSTLAAAITASHQNIPLVHVEGGERIYRRHDVPEEVNRILTDHAATLVLASTRRAMDYLRREGFAIRRTRFVGDPMYDLFQWGKQRFQQFAKVTPESLNLIPGQYHLATIHRAENTKTREILLQLLAALDSVELPVVLPVHPRVGNLIKQWDYKPRKSLRLIEPLGYFDFLSMLLSCARVLTDSGGVTRESFFAEKPCIIPMSNSWWTEVVESGWALEVGTDTDRIVGALNGFSPSNELPQGLFGDGVSATKIVREIVSDLDNRSGEAAWHRHGAFWELPKSVSTDFTLPNYRDLLLNLRERGYRFAAFPEAAPLLKEKQQFALMRHDIDISLHRALEMAEVEASVGVSATYFFMIRNDFYNVFSKEGSQLVSRVLELGHQLGLHFDCASYPDDASEESLAESCNAEAEMLKAWFKMPVQIVSYHRPNAFVLSGNSSLSEPLPHTYMPLYTKSIWYSSDSCGAWKHGHPLELAATEEGRPLHILVHPVWWSSQPIAPYQTLLKLTDERREAFEASIAENCTVYRVGGFKKGFES
jgi:UDP-N-acetylglucosamine 2-epimerase